MPIIISSTHIKKILCNFLWKFPSDFRISKHFSLIKLFLSIMKHELSSRILEYILIRNTEVRTSEVIVNFVKLRWWYTYLKAPSPRQTTCKSGLPNLCFFSASVSCRCSHFFRFNLIGTILILIISFISFRLLPIFLLLFHWSLLLPFRLRFNQLLRDHLLFPLDCQWT